MGAGAQAEKLAGQTLHQRSLEVRLSLVFLCSAQIVGCQWKSSLNCCFQVQTAQSLAEQCMLLVCMALMCCALWVLQVYPC